MSYEPDNDAKPVGTLFTRQLSQRDLSLSIPVNFVEHAGISLTAACFANNQYVADAAQRCFSNLLAIGFHRYEVDVYWDVRRKLWSLCPVQVGGDDSSSDEPSPTTTLASTASTRQETDLSTIAMSSAGVPMRRDVEAAHRRQATATDSQLDGMNLPQASPTPTTVDPNEASITTSSDAPATTASNSSIGGVPDGADYQQIGPYLCSASADLEWLSRIMWTYLDTTETNLNATLRYFILNLHAAASASDPAGSAEEPSSGDLPGSDDLLSSILVSNLSSFLYTPTNLREQRANINESWNNVPQGMGSTPGYYRVTGAKDMTSTPDGWPSEKYIEMREGKRLFVGFGSIDQQMQAYDVSRDSNAIFPQDYLQGTEQLAVNAIGQVTSGCYYEPSEYSVEVINNSWVFASNPIATTPNILFSSSNITRCGVSPILDVTLQNATADEDFLPYQTYLQSTIWAWAPGYPRVGDASKTRTDEEDSGSDDDFSEDLSSQDRCAALNASSGFWQNIACNGVHYSACRRKGSIYEWSISSDDATYIKAGLSCREGSEFDVPRTGLQNTYLVNTWRAHLSDPAIDERASSDQMLWLNFNTLDSELCWVVGQNSTCPYVNRRSDDRTVVVPIVAAVLVFALGVLTVFVKCAGNRQLNKRQKRRRRGDDGWDYEGVPS